MYSIQSDFGDMEKCLGINHSHEMMPRWMFCNNKCIRIYLMYVHEGVQKALKSGSIIRKILCDPALLYRLFVVSLGEFFSHTPALW